MKKTLTVKTLWAVLKYVQVFICFHIFYNITEIYLVSPNVCGSKGALKTTQKRKDTFEYMLPYGKGGYLSAFQYWSCHTVWEGGEPGLC